MSLARGGGRLCLALVDQGPEVGSSRSTSLALADQEAEVAVQLLQLRRSVPADWHARGVEEEDGVEVPPDLSREGTRRQPAPHGVGLLTVDGHLGHEVHALCL
jgi:hypothetical protein